jgi:hypothetical protein
MPGLARPCPFALCRKLCRNFVEVSLTAGGPGATDGATVLNFRPPLGELTRLDKASDKDIPEFLRTVLP